VAGQIQPASLDLRLGKVAYRVSRQFLPVRELGCQAHRRIEAARSSRSPRRGAGNGVCLYVPLIESLEFARDIAAATNPKSSTGASTSSPRVIADETRGFDRIELGYHGPLYAEISPRTFRCWCAKVRGCRKSAFRHGNAQVDAEALRWLHARERLVERRHGRREQGVPLSVDLAGSAPTVSSAIAPSVNAGLIDCGSPRRLRCGRLLGADPCAQGSKPDPRP